MNPMALVGHFRLTSFECTSSLMQDIATGLSLKSLSHDLSKWRRGKEGERSSNGATIRTHRRKWRLGVPLECWEMFGRGS